MYPLLFQEPLQVDRITIAIANLPSTLTGLKLVQLSDLHYDGKRLSDKLLEEAIAAANAAEADLILLTGDYITDNPSPIERLVLHLKHLQSRYGIYACLGNHDIYFPNSKQPVINALTRIGIQVLWNEIAYPVGAGIPPCRLSGFLVGSISARWRFRPTRPQRTASSPSPTTPIPPPYCKNGASICNYRATPTAAKLCSPVKFRFPYCCNPGVRGFPSPSAKSFP
jgi:hypothetical protein